MTTGVAGSASSAPERSGAIGAVPAGCLGLRLIAELLTHSVMLLAGHPADPAPLAVRDRRMLTCRWKCRARGVWPPSVVIYHFRDIQGESSQHALLIEGLDVIHRRMARVKVPGDRQHRSGRPTASSKGGDSHGVRQAAEHTMTVGS